MKYFFVAVVLLIATIAPAWADKAKIRMIVFRVNTDNM